MLLRHVIRTRLGKGPDALRKMSAGILMIRRWVMQTLDPHQGRSHLLLIFGCQRSGTTLLSRIFEGDPTVCSFAEHSRSLSRRDHLLRTRPLPELEKVFQRCKGRLIVAKPLVESQRATEFLEHFPEARAVWSYRHYRDVVRSFVKLFDRASVNIMKKVVDRADNWASESVSETSREIVLRFYRPDMPLNDAAAIYWLLRNSLYFEQALDRHPRVRAICYDDLVSRPDETMRSVYSFLGFPYPGSHLVGGVHADSRGLGRSVELDPEIEALCESMWVRLKASDEAPARAVDAASPEMKLQ